jgi:hypothetical protein
MASDSLTFAASPLTLPINRRKRVTDSSLVYTDPPLAFSV